MVDIPGLGGLNLPSKETMMSGLSTSMQWAMWFFIIVVILGLIGLIAYFIVRLFKFNKKIVVFGKVNGQWQKIATDRAMELPIGTAGDRIHYWQKMKAYRPRPEIQMGKNEYWYAKREDGELVNITLEDIDLKMKLAKVRYIHPDMRYAKEALNRNLFQRHQEGKKGFMEKYGVILVPLATLAICGLVLFFVTDNIMTKQNAISAAQTASLEASKNLMDTASKVIASLDRMSTSSGLTSGG